MDANFKDKYPNACDACIQRAERVRKTISGAIERNAVNNLIHGTKASIGDGARSIWNDELQMLANCQHKKGATDA